MRWGGRVGGVWGPRWEASAWGLIRRCSPPHPLLPLLVPQAPSSESATATAVRHLRAANGIRARVVTQLAPVWTTDWMSDSARDKLLAYGIAPPRCSANDAIQGGSEGSADVGYGPSGRLAGPADASVRVLQFAARPRMASSLSISVPCPQCRSDNTTETSHFGSTACKAMYRCLDCLEPFDYFKPY